MVSTRYSREPPKPEMSCKARGSDLRVHFKNTRETAAAIKGMSLKRAKAFLNNVIEKKEIVPFVRYRYGVGRKAQVKNWALCGASGRWPEKSCRVLLNLLRNAEVNAERKGLDTDNLAMGHIQVNKAMQGRRRMYRAHGRISPFMSHPCHIEMWLVPAEQEVPKEAEQGIVLRSKKGRSAVRSRRLADGATAGNDAVDEDMPDLE